MIGTMENVWHLQKSEEKEDEYGWKTEETRRRGTRTAQAEMKLPGSTEERREKN